MKNIFVVDDSPTTRACIEQILTVAGYNVELAADGVIALEKILASSNPIDVFLFDIIMPNMDGISLVKKVRELEKYKSTPILILTTESNDSKKIEGKNVGATGWIVKPFEPEQLISLIERFAGEKEI